MRLRKIVVERVTVVKFRVDNRGSDGTGCFRIEVRTIKIIYPRSTFYLPFHFPVTCAVASIAR